ncbi:MAG: ABC transporter permease [Deltaproteobacteria bacterium]|nr:ABC transporter permease [Deltaproteobacteria bacterium]
MIAWVASVGAGCISFVEQTGLIARFFAQMLGWCVRPPFRFRLFLEQFLFVANASAFIVCLTGIFTGMVFAVQIYFGFRMIDPAPLVGPAVAIGFVRELGPVFTAIVVTGRAGAAMAAQLGTMRVTEQIDAMDVMAVNSIQYLVVPRILASFLAMPLLCALFVFIGNVGSYGTGVYLLNIDPVIFFSHLQEIVQVRDLIQGLIKAAAFGIIFSTIGTFKGYYTKGGAEAVGRSTNEAVVVTLVLILVGDYFLTLVIRALLYRQL